MNILTFNIYLLCTGVKASLLPPTPILLLADGRELTVKGDAPLPLVSFVLFLGADLVGLTVLILSAGICSFDNCFW